MARPYHHGDLRAALLDAALQAVEAGGHATLSLRDLAQGLGVSHAAPYRHFPNRQALLAAVAATGFARLAEAWLAAWQGAGTTGTDPVAPAARLKVAARAYIGFATERPALFRLMFQGPPPPGAEAAFAGLQATVAAALPGVAEAVVKARTIAMWSALHGFAWLCLEHRIRPAMLGPLAPGAMLEAVLDAALGPLNQG
jgi:AcrR family transcriptional regulator